MKLVIAFTALALMLSQSAVFNYALDYQLEVLNNNCTFELYQQDRFQCIKQQYLD